MKNKQITEKNEKNSIDQFKVPIQLKLEKEKNVKIYNQLLLLMKNKPIIYKDEPIDLVKWMDKVIRLYKLLK
jgi:hypothetical protein